MILLHELGIGNYIKLNGKPVLLEKHNLLPVTESTDINGVTLDSAILTKCGFEEIGTGVNPDTGESETVYKNGDIYLSQIKELFFIKIGIVYFKIPYLHRLQNLYAALTGEELTVKL